MLRLLQTLKAGLTCALLLLFGPAIFVPVCKSVARAESTDRPCVADFDIDGDIDGEDLSRLAIELGSRDCKRIFCWCDAGPGEMLIFDVGRGHIGSTTVKLMDENGAPSGTFTWDGINQESPQNVGTFQIPVSNLNCPE